MTQIGDASIKRPCHVCKTEAAYVDYGLGATIIECPRCGPYMPFLPQGTLQTFGSLLGESVNRRSRLSHTIRRQQRDSQRFVTVQVSELERMGLDEPVTTPSQQVDNLIIWCGERQKTFSNELELPTLEVLAWIGAHITHPAMNALFWLLKGASGYFEVDNNMSGDRRVRLTFQGWERYEQLKHEAPTTRTAFLAMQFEDDVLNDVVAACFQPAAKRAGFELSTLTNRQPAGSIDDQMRVRLRTARFVVADLTHGNNGAYWEAGFAEGLGRPVIYTCRRQAWEKEKTHFDTNHLVTIIWDEDELATAADQLTATIRATLPAEAVMEDVA